MVGDVREIHIFPLAVDLPDIFHEKAEWARVDNPFPECALCAAGACVQREGPGTIGSRLFVHARSEDG